MGGWANQGAWHTPILGVSSVGQSYKMPQWMAPQEFRGFESPQTHSCQSRSPLISFRCDRTIRLDMVATTAYQLSGLGHQAVEVDPSAPGTVIRGALLFESLANIPFAVACLAYPRWFMEFFVANPADITPVSVSFLQLVGVSTIMLSFLMWSAIPNTRSGIETRRPTYYMLLIAESLMLSLWYYQGWVLGEEGSGLQKNGVLKAMSNIVPLVIFRGVSLFLMPQWFGRYRIKAKAL